MFPEAKLPTDFGNHPFDTAYMVVDGIVFVPSVRRQVTSDPEQPTCAAEMSREDLLEHASEYRQAGGDPCATCSEQCEELHPTSAMDVLAESAKDVLIDAPLKVASGILEALGLDPTMIKVVIFAVAVALLRIMIPIPGNVGRVVWGTACAYLFHVLFLESDSGGII